MASPPPNSTHHSHQNPNQPANFMPSVRAASEKKMGLLHFISPANHGWHGDVRKRFTDFLVNEIRKDGQVLRLNDYHLGERPMDANLHIPGQYNAPKQNNGAAPGPAPVPEISADDVTSLRELLTEEVADAVIALHERIVASTTRLDPKSNSVKFPPMERHNRGHVHQEIRRIFASKIDTETDQDGIITAVPSKMNSRQPRSGGQRPRSNQTSFKKLGGDYLHFTLYKENKDTMDAINQIGRMLKVKSNSFGFAGTKDRRAATVQRISVFRVRHQTLDFLNTQVPAIKMGDYKYSPHPIQLGDHGGNEFKITVKNVSISRGEQCGLERRIQLTKQAVEVAVTEIAKYGFINYFGLQRFGTHVVGTHELGKLMLMEDYEGVIDGLLHVDEDFMSQVISGNVQETPSNRDEINRVRAIVQFKTAKNAKAALQAMPKRFGSESNVIQHLDKNPRDFQGAILTITRGMRNLYLHAYQSYVWNHAASHRWAKYGSKVMPGDLVLVKPDKSGAVGGSDDMEAPDESGFQRARALSAEEVQSGKYSIFDVVLPAPGFDVIYPENDIGEYYVEFMRKPENGGLDPHRMRRPKKDFSMSGAYRNVLGQFKGEPRWEVRTYVDDNEQMRPTDLDLVDMRKAEEKAKEAGQQQSSAAESSKLADEASIQKHPRQGEGLEADPRGNDVWVQTSDDSSSKRIKFKHVSRPNTPDSMISRISHGGGGGGGGGVTLHPEGDDPQVEPGSDANGDQKPAKPIRQPTGPDSDSTGFTAPPSRGDASSKAVTGDPADTACFSSPTFNEALAFETLNKHLRESDDAAAAAATPARQTPAALPVKNTRFGKDAIHAFTQSDLSGVKEDQIKIAVVLEFSLNQSAYATVVLRELMASVEPEKPGSPLYP